MNPQWVKSTWNTQYDGTVRLADMETQHIIYAIERIIRMKFKWRGDRYDDLVAELERREVNSRKKEP